MFLPFPKGGRRWIGYKLRLLYEEEAYRTVGFMDETVERTWMYSQRVR
jgi:hypothetical protein